MKETTTTTISQLPDAKTAFAKPEWYFQRLNYRVKLRRQVVSELAQRLKFRDVLDVGCGDGSISAPLLTENRHLTFLDVSPAMLDRARANVPAHLAGCADYVHGDIRAEQLKAQSFDLIVCLGVLAYIDDVNAFVKQLHGLLRPGAHMIFECSDGAHFLSRFMRRYSAMTGLLRKHRVGLAIRSSREVSAHLTRAGFQVKKTYRYSTPLPLVRNVFSQEFHYRTLRMLHGNSDQARMSFLGNECIYLLQKPI